MPRTSIFRMFPGRNLSTDTTLDGLVRHFHAKENRTTLGAGTRWVQTQEWCYEIRIPKDTTHVLREILEAAGPSKAA